MAHQQTLFDNIVSMCVYLSQFLSEVEAWCKVCSEGGLPSEMQELELAIHRHQSLYEQVTQAYTEVSTQTTTLKVLVVLKLEPFIQHFLVRYFLWKNVQGNTQSTKLDFLNYYLLQITCLC